MPMSGPRSRDGVLTPPRFGHNNSVLGSQRGPDLVEEPTRASRSQAPSPAPSSGTLLSSYAAFQAVTCSTRSRRMPSDVRSAGLPVVGPQRAGAVVGPELQDSHPVSLTTVGQKRTHMPRFGIPSPPGAGRRTLEM